MTISHAMIGAPPAVMAGLLLVQESVQPPGTRMDPTLFAAAVVTVISSVGGVIVLIINSVSAARDRRDAATERRILLEKTDTADAKANTIIEKTAEIHTLADGTNSTLRNALALMAEKNTALEAIMRQMQSEKLTTAARLTVTDAQTAAALAKPSSEGV